MSLNKRLVDLRGRASFRFDFGTVSDAARHCGITIVERDGYSEFSGSKSKLQMFAEKLHFSKVSFTETPPK